MKKEGIKTLKGRRRFRLPNELENFYIYVIDNLRQELADKDKEKEKAMIVCRVAGKNIVINENNICHIEYYTTFPYSIDEYGRPSYVIITFNGGNSVKVRSETLPKYLQNLLAQRE